MSLLARSPYVVSDRNARTQGKCCAQITLQELFVSPNIRLMASLWIHRFNNNEVEL